MTAAPTTSTATSDATDSKDNSNSNSNDAPSYTIEEAYERLQNDKTVHSRLKKYLTAEVFAELKGKKTSTGVTLLDVIRSGVEQLDSSTGIYAPDVESYAVFASLFHPIILERHLGYNVATDRHPPANFDPAVAAKLFPRKFPSVVSTRIRVARSVSGFALGASISDPRRLELEQAISSALCAMTDPELKGTYYPLAKMSAETQQQMIADHFLFKKGDRFLESAQLNRDWPNGRGIFVNKHKTFLVWISEEDHMRIISMQMGGDIFAVFNRLGKAIAFLNTKLKFSYDERLGYISSCPSNLGTGMRASVHMPLHGMVAKFNNDTKALKEYVRNTYGVQLRGVHGEHSESTGNVYDVSNIVRLGKDEMQCAQQMYDGVCGLADAEAEMASAKVDAASNSQAK